jgi:O-antigen/teichoic acid export membrane protein
MVGLRRNYRSSTSRQTHTRLTIYQAKRPTLENTESLTNGGLLARNTLWNLLGNGAPLIVAVFSIPILIAHLGKDRFGILALAWTLIGYASLFDLGLGRALTQIAAKMLVGSERDRLPVVVWTSLGLMLILGFLGTAATGCFAPILARRILNVPSYLQMEALQSFYLLGICIPLVVVTAGLRGLFEAHQRFGLVNALRIPMGIYTFLGPLLVLPLTTNLAYIVAVLILGRLLALIAHVYISFRLMPDLRGHAQWCSVAALSLLRFGGWMTVSNVISPLMVNMDRFLIGALVSMSAVTYYATPFEVISKLLFIPAALVGVLFPAFSSSFARNPHRATELYIRCSKYLFFILFPATLMIVGFAHDGLSLWLGNDFAQHSSRVLQWLAIGILVNGLANVPFALVQGAGRPDQTAKLHVAELPFYLLALWFFTYRWGIEGTAIAWVLRVTVDAFFLILLSRPLLPNSSRLTRQSLFAVAISLVSLLGLMCAPSSTSRVGLIGGLLLLFTGLSWSVLLTPAERIQVRTRLRPSAAAIHGD